MSANETEVWTINHEKEKKIIVTHVNVRTSIFFLITKLILLDIIATVIVLLFFSPFLFPLPVEVKTLIVSSNVWYFLLLAFGKIVLTLYIVLSWLNEYYEIKPTQIVYRRGILWRKEDVYDLNPRDPAVRISSIGIQQGLLGRIFNYGTLFFYDRGTYKYEYLHYIHNPLRYFEILHNLLPNAAMEKEIIREHFRDKE